MIEDQNRIVELEQKYEQLRQLLIAVIEELPPESRERLAWMLVNRWLKAGTAG